MHIFKRRCSKLIIRMTNTDAGYNEILKYPVLTMRFKLLNIATREVSNVMVDAYLH